MIQACKQANRQVIGTSTSNLILVDYHIPQEKKKVQFGGQRGKEKQAGASKNTKENKQNKQEKVF